MVESWNFQKSCRKGCSFENQGVPKSPRLGFLLIQDGGQGPSWPNLKLILLYKMALFVFFYSNMTQNDILRCVFILGS